MFGPLIFLLVAALVYYVWKKGNSPKIQDGAKQCSYCAMKIPAEANICPYCRKNLGATWGVKIVVGLFLFGAIVNALSQGSKDSEDAPRKKVEDPKLIQAIAGGMTLKKAMRNPDSFKLSSVILMPSGAACYEFRAQNGFGGVNVSKAVMSVKGGGLKTNEMDGFASIWNQECADKTGTDILDAVEYSLK
jgi:hypothetical protein